MNTLWYSFQLERLGDKRVKGKEVNGRRREIEKRDIQIERPIVRKAERVNVRKAVSEKAREGEKEKGRD